jgi:hypothetical protein
MHQIKKICLNKSSSDVSNWEGSADGPVEEQSQNKIKTMNKTQKALLVTAAIAGLVGGTIANTKAKSVNNQGQNTAGKQVPGAYAALNGCNGCPSPKTNAVILN